MVYVICISSFCVCVYLIAGVTVNTANTTSISRPPAYILYIHINISCPSSFSTCVCMGIKIQITLSFISRNGLLKYIAIHSSKFVVCVIIVVIITIHFFLLYIRLLGCLLTFHLIPCCKNDLCCAFNWCFAQRNIL